MPVTNFPDGINAGNSSGVAADLQIGGTAISPVGGVAAGYKLARGTSIITAGSVDVSSGLTTTSFVVASVYGNLLSTAGTVGGFVTVTAQPASGAGSITLRAYDQMGTISGASGTASWIAVGA